MKILYILLPSIILLHAAHAQVAINTTKTAANASAMLDISNTNKGLLIPRITLTGTNDVNTIKVPATSLLIYNTATAGTGKLAVTPGYYYYNGSTWVPLAGSSASTGNGWALTGNAGTSTANNFIGTTDNQPLRFRINNQPAGELNNLDNISFGIGSLPVNEIGRNNISIGSQTLYNNNSGSENIAIGSSSLLKNISGHDNIAIGVNALLNNTSANDNIAIGAQTLSLNKNGTENIAIGKRALEGNKTGYSNIAIGTGSLGYPDFVHNVVAIGDSALYQQRNTENQYYGNTAVGSKALYDNRMGQSNTALGFESLKSNQDGSKNTGIGTQALFTNNSGVENTAVGFSSLKNNNEGSGNTSVGTTSLFSNIVGNNNSAFGVSSLAVNTFGDRNTAIGYRSLFNNTISSDNTALGTLALYLGTGNTNTALGSYALYGTKSGYGNVAVGFQALQYNSTGNNNTAVGTNAGPANGSGAFDNSTAIGQGAVYTGSSQVRLGNTFVTSIGGYADFKNISDIRFKKNVKPATHGLDFILKLEPITYNLDVQKLNHFMYGQAADTMFKGMQLMAINNKESIVTSGFSAQQVETASKAIGYDFNGVEKPQNDKDHYSLSYSSFVVPLVKAVQEQQVLITDLQQTVKQLEEKIAILLAK